MTQEKSSGIARRNGENASEGLKNAFLRHVGDNMERLRNGFMANCRKMRLPFDDDVFSDTILKCAEKILSSGISDPSEKGFEYYFFSAFMQNTKREGQYARVAKRSEMSDEDMDEAYEKWCGENIMAEDEKVRNDLVKDFSVLYIMSRVEERFPENEVQLFRIKYLMPHMTYRKLSERTGQRNVRDKVVAIRKWLQENVSREDMMKAFWDTYGNECI